MEMMKLGTVMTVAGLLFATACSPAVGSKEWCQELKNKDKGQWTAQEVKDFAKNCILPK